MSQPKLPRADRRFFANPKRRRELCKLLAIGASRVDAANKLGTTRRTIWNECDRDPEFKRAVEQAEAAGKVALITCVHAAGKKDWRAAMAMLQAKYFEWSRNAHDSTPNKEVLRMMRQFAEGIRKTIPPEYHAAICAALDGPVESLIDCGDEGDDDDGN